MPLLALGTPLLCRTQQICHGVVLLPQAAVGHSPVCRWLHPSHLPVSKAPLQSAVITSMTALLQACNASIPHSSLPPTGSQREKKCNRKLSAEVIVQQMENRASEDLRTIPDFPAKVLTLPALAARNPLFYTVHLLAPSSSWKLPELQLNSRREEISSCKEVWMGNALNL